MREFCRDIDAKQIAILEILADLREQRPIGATFINDASRFNGGFYIVVFQPDDFTHPARIGIVVALGC